MSFDFAGKTVLITGASAGIGAGLAVEFAKCKANLVLNARNVKVLEATKKVCVENGIRDDQVALVVGDIIEDKIQQAIVDAAINNFGRIDVLVNNAGKTETIPIINLKIQDFDEILNLNLRAPVGLALLALPHLMKTKGNVVNISSLSSIRPTPVRLSYSTSKAGLDMFTKTLAYNAAQYGIRVNSVNPGVVPTEFGREESQDPIIKERIKLSMKNLHPIGRVGRMEEVTDAVLFLASNKSSFTTGQIFCVDGGAALGGIVAQQFVPKKVATKPTVIAMSKL